MKHKIYRKKPAKQVLLDKRKKPEYHKKSAYHGKICKSKFLLNKRNKKNIKCPNCGHTSMKFLLGMWLCHECEYHSHKKTISKKVKGSFR